MKRDHFNEDLNDIIRNIKSLENSGVVIDGLSETVKHDIKYMLTGYMLTGKGVVRTGKSVAREGIGYNKKNKILSSTPSFRKDRDY